MVYRWLRFGLSCLTPLLNNISVILLWCIEVHFPDPDVCYKHDDQEENKILASDLTNTIIKILHVAMVTLHQPMITNMFIVVFIVFLGFEDLM